MPVPSKAWVVIADGQVDADSPLDTTLMTGIRDDLVHLEEWLGMSYTAAQDHDHDGINSKTVVLADSVVTQAKMADAAVGQAELKSTTGEVSTTSATLTNLTLPGGSYGFYPQVKMSAVYQMESQITSGLSNIGTSYVTIIALKSDGAATAYALHRYFQASPPYMIGNTLWGHFLFLLRDIATGTVRAAYEAEDPPWAHNGAIYLPKDDPGRLAAVPHPFTDYWTKDPAIDGLEIVMVDLSTYDTKKWKADNAKLGKGILEDIGAVVKGKGIQKAHADYLLLNIPKFTDKVKIILP